MRATGQGATVSNAGTTQTTLYSNATSGDVWSQANLRLYSLAHVTGAVHAPSVQADLFAKVDGATSPPGTIQHVPLRVTFPAAQGSGDVIVLPGLSVSLVPGRYRNVSIGLLGRLELTAGSYYFETLLSDPVGKLVASGASGPAHVFVRAALQLGKVDTTEDGGRGDLLVAYFGTQVAKLLVSFRGALVAPSALLEVAPGCVDITGSLFAKTVTFLGGSHVQYSPANLLGPLLNAPTDVEACSNTLRARPGLETDNAALQADIARYCTSPEVSACMATLIGRSNADYSSSARQLQQNLISPSQYLALSRDRERKMAAAWRDASQAAAYCAGADADLDWVPDSTDACPGTTPLTATDDRGCPMAALPPGPSGADVQKVLGSMNMAYNPRCGSAPVFPSVTAGAFYKPLEPARGSYIFSSRIRNQAPGCPVFYEFEIEELDVSMQRVADYYVVFRDTEELTALVGSPAPVPPDFIQFNPLPTDPNTRGVLGSAGPRRVSVRFRVRAMNGNGVHGPWSVWKITNDADCRNLGFDCGGGSP